MIALAEDMLADLCDQRLLCQPFERIDCQADKKMRVRNELCPFFDAVGSQMFRSQHGVC